MTLDTRNAPASAEDRTPARASSALGGIKVCRYDPHWRILSLRGYFWAPAGTESVRVVDVQGQVLGEADTGFRHIDKRFAEKYGGWVYEAPVPEETVAAGGPLTVRCRARDGGELRFEVPLEAPPKPAPVEPDPTQVIFLCIHNLDIEDRVIKLRCVEAIDAQLRSFGWRLVVVHHSPFRLESAVESVHFTDIVKQAWRLPGRFLRRGHFPRRLREAEAFLHGFHRNLGKRTTRGRDRAQVEAEAKAFRHLVQRYRPHLCLLWHEWNSFAHMNRAVCEAFGIPVMFMHEGFLPHTLGLDKHGEMAESWPLVEQEVFHSLPLDAHDLERARAYLAHVREEGLDRKRQTKPGAVREVLAPVRAAGKRVLFYAGVNDWQTGMLPTWWPRAREHSPHYVDTYDCLAHLVELAEREDFVVLFKPHPNVPARLGDLPREHLVLMHHANVLECVQQSDATATLVSTVAYGALTHGKPVVLLGRNSLTGTGAVFEATGPREAGAAVGEALTGHRAAHAEAFEGHVARLLRYYLFPYTPAMEPLLGRSFRDTARFLVKNAGAGVIHEG